MWYHKLYLYGGITLAIIAAIFGIQRYARMQERNKIELKTLKEVRKFHEQSKGTRYLDDNDLAHKLQQQSRDILRHIHSKSTK